MSFISILVLLSQVHHAVSDFFYADFNRTAGLVFNGAAATTDCGEASAFSDAPAAHDGDAPGLYQYGRTATTDVFSTVRGPTSAAPNGADASDAGIAAHAAVLGHRSADALRHADADDFGGAGCSTRLRLTPSHPAKAGAVWYESRVPVLTGFETTFSWQITGQSVECTERVERSFSRHLHRSCAVHGGDGFAFVLHGGPADAAALGGDGEQLGYGGISNSVAIEFDTWTNVDTQQSDDVFQDHVSIHSGGPHAPNSADRSTSLGSWRPCAIADGKVHEAKIQFLPFVETRYFELMTANENLVPYLKDNGEGRRIGTLAVFVDQGIVEDRPLLAIPVNLSLLLDLPDGLAYVGFTASTGRRWETHDILNWNTKAPVAHQNSM